MVYNFLIIIGFSKCDVGRNFLFFLKKFLFVFLLVMIIIFFGFRGFCGNEGDFFMFKVDVY